MSKDPKEQLSNLARELERLYIAIKTKNKEIAKLNAELSTAKSSSDECNELKEKINSVALLIDEKITDGGKKKKRSRSRKRKY